MFSKITQLIGASLFFILITFSSCGKKEITASSPGALPTVETVNLFEPNISSVKTGCIVRSSGRGQLIEAGICWSKNPEPTTADKTISLTTSLGTYTRQVLGLEAGFTYYFRAYSTNSFGTSYGEQMSITTLSEWKEVPSSQLVINSFNPSLAALGNTVFIHDIANRVYRSTDNGDTWQLYNNGLSGMTGMGLMTIAQQSLIIVETNGQGFATDLNSNSWTLITPPMSGNEALETITSINVKDNKLVITKPAYNVYEAPIGSTFGWNRLYFFSFYYNRVNHMVTKGNLLLAGTSNYLRFYSSGDLANWSNPTNGAYSNFTFKYLAVNGEDIYASTNFGTYLSTNNGVNWTQTDPYNSLAVDFQNYVFGGGYIVASTNYGFKISSNKGNTWEDFYKGLPGATFGYSGLIASSDYFFTVVSKNTGYKLFRTKF
jgi:hypothetical protein